VSSQILFEIKCFKLNKQYVFKQKLSGTLANNTFIKGKINVEVKMNL